jgi:hypothetical protein
MFPQASEFEQLLQEVCSQGMQQVRALPSCRVILANSFQADLERLLIEFCEHLPVDFSNLL